MEEESSAISTDPVRYYNGKTEGEIMHRQISLVYFLSHSFSASVKYGESVS